MSRARLHSWFFASSVRRVVAEIALLTFVLALLVAFAFGETGERLRSSVLAQGAFEMGLLAGLLGAVRMPFGEGAWRHLLPGEVGKAIALALGVWAPLILIGLASTAWQGPLVEANEAWEAALTPVVFGGFAAIGTLITYAICRLIARAWAFWNRLRRTRLRWALTHALLIVSLVVAVIAATIITATDIGGNVFTEDLPELELERIGAFHLQTILYLVIRRFVPSALAIFLFSLIAGVIIVPPVAVIAFPVLGRATKRLEELAGATAELRRGDLAARSPVSGEDEIARLQTDFNAMAESLQQAQGALRAERDAVATLLDDRRALIAAVSHELRTPVATVRGYLESALTHWDGAPPPTLRHDLEIMTAETERLHRLIDDLFTLSRAEIDRLPLTIEPTAVGPLLQRVAETAAPLAWERGRVDVLAKAPDGLPPARADADRLEQAVRNLVANAVRHTPPGGVVLLTAERGQREVVIRVNDTGEGIAAADLPHIWDRFYRGTRASEAHDGQDREGAGLGLALVKELTEAMGGTIAVTSVPGEGSCFSLRLPIA